MVEIKFDGKIEGKPVKGIQRTTQYGTTYMAKPKFFDVNTPHIEVLPDGRMEVHEDSYDGRLFRVMQNYLEGSIDSATSHIRNEGMDMAVFPMYEANGFTIDTWCLRIMGKFGPWKQKTKPL
jgi:hypothetical protein